MATESNEEPINKDNIDFAVYKKRKITLDQVKRYNALMCAVWAVKFSVDDKVVDFSLTANEDGFDSFDDVVLTVRFQNEHSATFLIQLKHTGNNPENDKITTTKLTEDETYCLSNYHKETYKELTNTTEFGCILYTNSDAEFGDGSNFMLDNNEVVVKDFGDFTHKQLLSDQNNPKSRIFKFDNAENSQDNRNFECFYLFSGQKNITEVGSLLKELLQKSCGIENNSDVSIFKKYMEDWWTGNFVLRKRDVLWKLAEVVFSPSIQTLSGKKLNERTELLWEAFMKFDMTLVKGDDDIICQTWNKRRNTGEKDEIKKVALKYGLSSGEIQNIRDLSTLDGLKALWYLDELPFVLKLSGEEWKRIKFGIELLEKSGNKKKLMLVGHVPEETSFCDWNIFDKLFDLDKFKTTYKEIVETFYVSVQGGPKATLEKFINGDADVAKIIETKELIQMSQDVLDVGDRAEELPPFYISRSVKNEESVIIEEHEIYERLKNTVNVICAQPGMGKSTMMTYLKANCPAKYWSIRVNLIHHVSLFRTDPKFKDLLHSFEPSSNETTFVNSLRKHFLGKYRRIVLLLDGLDEIDKESVEFVLKYINYISSKGVKVWLSSRQNLRQQICETLKVTAVDIQEFTKQQRKDYIQKRLEKKFKEKTIDKIVEKVFSSADVTNSSQLLGVPLLLYIVTENFMRNPELTFNLDQKSFVLTKMYSIFFDGKKRHYYKKLQLEEYEDHLPIDFEEALAKYEHLALKVCLSDEDLEALGLDLGDSVKFLERISHSDPFGIISGAKDSLAVFIHQTFAEYFSCAWFAKNLDKVKLLKNTFYSRRYENLRLILDIMLAEKNPLHLAVIYKNMDQFLQHVDKHEQKDLGGRSALHLVSYYNKKKDKDGKIYSQMFEELQSTCDLLSKDTLFEWNCFDYSFELMCFHTIQKILKSSSSCLEEPYKSYQRKFLKLLNWSLVLSPGSVPYGLNPHTKVDLYNSSNRESEASEDIEIIRILFNNGSSVNSTNKNGWSAMHEACFLGLYKVVQFLLDSNANIHLLTNSGDSVLHAAAEAKQPNKAVVNLLLKNEVDVNIKNQSGKTALHFCSDPLIADLLIENGADPAVKDRDGKNVLDYAIAKGNWELAGVFTQTDSFSGSLNYAVYSGNRDLVNVLLGESTDARKTEAEEKYPLDFVSENNRTLYDANLLEITQEVTILREENQWSHEKVIDYLRAIYSDWSENTNSNNRKRASYDVFMYVFYGLKFCFDDSIIKFELVPRKSDDAILVRLTRRNEVTRKDLIFFIKFTCDDHHRNYGLSRCYEIYKELEKEENVRFLFYTNNRKNAESLLESSKSLKMRESSDHNVFFLNEENTKNRFFQLEIVTNIINSFFVKDITKEFKDLLPHFFIYVDPRSNAERESMIAQNLKKYCRIEDPISVVTFIKFMERAWLNNITINKHDVIVKLSELIFSPWIQVLTADKVNDKTTVLRQAIIKFDMTIVKDDKDDIVRHIWKDVSRKETEVSDVVFKYGLSNQKNTKFDQLSPINKTKALWFLNQVPLILQLRDQKNPSIEYGIRLLEEEEVRLKLLLLGNIPDQYVSKWQTFKNLYDLSKYKDVYTALIEKFSMSIKDDEDIAKIVEVEELLKMSQEIFSTDEKNDNLSVVALHLAARRSNYDYVKLLVDRGIDIKHLTTSKGTILHSAAEAEQPNQDVINLLLDRGVDINETNAEGITALHLAAKSTIYANVDLLIARYALQKTTNLNDTPLHWAAQTNQTNKEVIELLITKGADINQKGSVGATALHFAAKTGVYENFRVLLNLGAQLNHTESDETVLHYAARAELPNQKIMEELLTKGIDINKQNSDGETALHLAASTGIYENVDTLIAMGAEITATASKRTVLHYAAEAEKGNTRVISLLLDKGIDINQQDMHGVAAVHIAALKGIISNFDLLVTRGAQLKLVTNLKNTALHEAAQAEHPNKEIINLLLDKGISNNEQNTENATALHFAAEKGVYENVQLLIKRGAQWKQVTKSRDTVFHYAARAGKPNKDVMGLLLEKGMDINKQNQQGATALHIAAAKGVYENVEFLLSRGAQVTGLTKNKETLLHFAVRQSDKRIVDLLVNKGLNINQQDRMGRTAFNIANYNNKIEFVQLLLHCGADPNIRPQRR